MVDQAADGLMPACPDRHFQRIEGETGTQVISDPPAENAAGKKSITNAVYTQPGNVST